MISCAYALLFLGNEGPNRHSSSSYLAHQGENNPTRHHGLRSLVILADGFKTSFYGAYEFPHDGQFPTPEASHDIAKTSVPNYGSSTKVAAYCSPSLSSLEIIEKFKYDITPMSKTYYTESAPMTRSERDCWDLTQSEWHKVVDNPSSWPKELAQNDKCSSRDIISLAYRGLLSVTGVYSEMAPTYKNENVKINSKSMGSSVESNNVPKVDIKSTMSLYDMVSQEKFFCKWHNGKKEKALVWYFGHLHLFERENRQKVWWPKTKIEVENSNGPTLIYFMRYYMKLFEKLDARISEYSLLYRAADSISCLSCIPLGTEVKSSKIMAEIRNIEIVE